jgi:hypothetical protein
LQLSGNRAGVYSPDVATDAVDLVSTAGNFTDSRFVAELWPGKPTLGTAIQGAVVDALGSVVALDSSTECQVRVEDGSGAPVPLLSKTTVVAAEGVITLSDVGVSAQPGTALTLLMRCFLANAAKFLVLSRPISVARLAVRVLPSLAEASALLSAVLFNVQLPTIAAQLQSLATGLPVVNLLEDESSCKLSIATQSGSIWPLAGPVLVGPFAATGTVAFPRVRAQPPEEDAGMPAQVLIACSLGAVSLPTLVIPTVYDAIVLRWHPSIQLPVFTSPSSRTSVVPIGGTGLAVQLWRSHSGQVDADDNVTVCELTIGSAVSGADGASVAALLLENSPQKSQEGVATFATTGLSAPFTTVVQLRVTCDRPAGGPELTVSHTVRVPNITTSWLDAPPALTLAFSPFVVRARLAGDGLASIASQQAPVCVLRVLQPDGSAATSAAAVQSAVDASALITNADETGVATFTVQLRAGDASRRAGLRVTCDVGSEQVSTVLQVVELLALRAALTSIPPAQILPSSSSLRLPLSPAPAVTVVTSAQGALPLVGTRCAVSLSLTAQGPSAGDNSQIVDTSLVNNPPSGVGYDNRLTRSRDLVAASLAWGLEPSPGWLPDNRPMRLTAGDLPADTLVPQAPGSFSPATPQLLHELTFDAVIVQGALGASLRLCLSCIRDGIETIEPLCSSINITDMKAVVVQPPASAVAPTSLFTAEIQLIDAQSGAPLAQDNETLCSLNVEGAADELTRVLGGSAVAVQGAVRFSALTLAARSGSQVTLVASCARGDIAVPVLSPSAFAVDVLACSPGFVSPRSGFGCEVCPDFTYTDGVGELACIRCPPRLATCIGGRLTLNGGYFISPQSITFANETLRTIVINDQLEVHPCFNAEACNFDTRARTFSCGYGYRGALCGVCDPAADYVRSGDLCVPCPSREVNSFTLGLVVVVLLAGLIYITLFRKVDITKTRSSIMIRIGLTYIQALGSLGIYKARGTAIFRAAMGIAETMSSSLFALGPVGCLLRPSFYTTFAVMITLPLLAAVLAVAIKAVYVLLRERNLDSLKLYFKQGGYIAPAIIVLYTAYPMLVTQAFRVLDCRTDLIGGVTYLKADLSVACFDSDHVAASAVAIIALLLFGGGIPLAVYLLLRRNRAQLGTDDVFSRYGFLYAGYDESRGLYWWECLILVRKALIVLLGSVISDPYFSILAAVLLTFVAAMLQTKYRPFIKAQHNRLEETTLIALCITQICCVFYLRSESIDEATQQDALLSTSTIVVTVVLLVMNLAVVANFLGEASLAVARETQLSDRSISILSCCLPRSVIRRIQRAPKPLPIAVSTRDLLTLDKSHLNSGARVVNPLLGLTAAKVPAGKLPATAAAASAAAPAVPPVALMFRSAPVRASMRHIIPVAKVADEKDEKQDEEDEWDEKDEGSEDEWSDEDDDAPAPAPAPASAAGTGTGGAGQRARVAFASVPVGAADTVHEQEPAARSASRAFSVAAFASLPAPAQTPNPAPERSAVGAWLRYADEEDEWFCQVLEVDEQGGTVISEPEWEAPVDAVVLDSDEFWETHTQR